MVDLNPFASRFTCSSLGHRLNPLANNFLPNRTDLSDEALLNHKLNPFADSFSPQSFSILENQGETLSNLNSNIQCFRHFSENIVSDSSQGLMFFPVLSEIGYLPANCFSPASDPSNISSEDMGRQNA